MLFFPYAAVLASAVSAAASPKHLKVDFSVSRGDSRSSATKGGYAKVVGNNFTSLQIANEQVYYSSTLRVGSNGDVNNVLVDTGSSDLWVVASDVTCVPQQQSQKRSIEDFPTFTHHRLLGFETDRSYPKKNVVKRAIKATSASAASASLTSCTSLGSFNTASSKSYKANATAPQFYIEYGDGSYAKGGWGSDRVVIGALNISDVNFAVVSETSSGVAVFGIGLPGLEVTSAYNDTGPSYTYENFPIRLKNTGVIDKVAYSLYLNDITTSSGSVLFGAVDHAKYYGQLQTVPIINIHPQYFQNPISFYVGVDSITLGDSKQNISISNETIPALLDSGTTLTYLPGPYVESIAASLNAKATKEGYYEVSCKYNTSSAFLAYNLSGVQIKAPLNDLILTDAKNKNCFLGLMPTRRPRAILGDSFLRHAYVVYNLEDYEISLAPVKYTSSENIEVISGSVPSAVKAPGYSSTSLVSSAAPGPTSSTLGTSGLKSSADSKSFYFAKSLLVGVVGLGLVLVL